MSNLRTLQIQNFRNLSDVTLECVPGFNILSGPNGSGKTSILEAIHVLASGRSFRTNKAPEFIAHDTQQTTIYCEAMDHERQLRAGYSRYRNGERRYKLGGNDIPSAAPIASLLPLQLIDADTHTQLFGRPKARRALLDWCAFHTVPDFLDTWRRYEATLRQANACLKHASARPNLDLWTSALSQLGEKVDQHRRGVVAKLGKHAQPYWQHFLPELTLALLYDGGWPEDLQLSTSLHTHRDRDIMHGHISRGPHRADCDFMVDGHSAQTVLSQGQQKILLYCLRLAAGQLVEETSNRKSIYLLDELPASLDEQRCKEVFSLLEQTGSQCFITNCMQASLTPLTNQDNTKIIEMLELLSSNVSRETLPT